MTILHVLDLGEIGGLLRVVQALAAGHRARGHRVHVAAVMHQDRVDHPLLVALRDAGVGVEPVRIPARGYLAERRHIAGLCRRLRPDVVHTHGYRPDLVDAGVARALGLPVVTTIHGFTGGGWKNRLNEWLQRRSLRRFAAVVAVSRSMADLLVRAGAPAPRVEIVLNAWAPTELPVDPRTARRALGIPDDRLHLGWVGRLSQEKGPDVLVDALAHLADLPLSASFIGDGPERGRLEARAAALGIEPRTRFHGIVPDASRLFPAFDVFVLSSRLEGTPIALFEAMAAGVPVVACRVGGVPEVVSDREALLVPAADPARLAAAIRSVATEPDAAAARARAARRRLEREFAIEPWLARYEAVYRSVRGNARSRRLS